MALLLLLISLSLAIHSAASELVVAHPIRSQLPLIARNGSTYSWTISQSTFAPRGERDSTSTAITYNATGLPPWLSFSPSSLSFSGSAPSSASPGSIPITVTASTASTGSVEDEFDLLVSTAHPPHVAIPLVQQFNDHNPALSGAFVVNPSSALPPYYSNSTPVEGSSRVGLRLLPSTEFSIGLQGGTFAPWPLSYTASLANGSQLPSWITYDPDTFTLDGTAPERADIPEPFEVVIAASDVEGYSAGPTARESFWISVASHELKLRDGNSGIARNVSVGTGFVLDLMDGPQDNPWMGEVYWDARPLSRANVGVVTMNVSDATGFSFDPASFTLSGSIPVSQMGSDLQRIPLAITDTQNLTLTTFLVLEPVPSFFVVPLSTNRTAPDGIYVSGKGELIIPTNYTSPLAFDLSKYMADNGPSLVTNGAVKLSTTIMPDVAKDWISFDTASLVLGGSIPSRGTIGSEKRDGAFSFTSERTTASTRKQHKHPMQHQVSVGHGQVYAAVPTSQTTETEVATTSVSRPLSTTSSLAQLAPASINFSSINVTFSAHSLESRTISTLHVIFLLDSNATCSLVSCSTPTTTNSGGSSDDGSRASRTGLILALVFISLLMTASLVACFFMWKRRRMTASQATEAEKQDSNLGEKVEHTGTKWGDPGLSSRDDLERGHEVRNEPSGRALIYSMAETRSAPTTAPASIGSGSRSGSPTVHEHDATTEYANGGHDAQGAISDSSGSRYDDGTSMGTRYGSRAGGQGGSMSGTDKEIVSSGESETEAGRLAPPSNAYARSISPNPSSASGATIPKQTFFAKLKNFGPAYRREDPSSQSSSGEEEMPPRAPPKPPARVDKPPMNNTSLFTNTMTVIKKSSLGSLFGLSNEEDAGSVGSKVSNRSQKTVAKSGSDKKLDIGKPRPLMPSLGAYLAKDHADQIARAAASAGITSRTPTDDGGSGFVAGNAVIYSMENRPLPITRSSSLHQDESAADQAYPAFTWPSPVQPASAPWVEDVPLPEQKSQRSMATATKEPEKHPSVPTLLRKRSNEAEVSDNISQHGSLSSSSDDSTLRGEEESTNSRLADLSVREVPRRRQDFTRPRANGTDSDEPGSTALGLLSTQHSRADSQDTVDSLAVIGTAALVIRSPLAGARVVPSLKPSHSSTSENGPMGNRSPPHQPSQSPPSSVHSAPTVKARLVQFVHEKQYDGGSSSEGVSSDEPVAGAYSAYQGKREMSHKAVIEGYEPNEPSKWDAIPPVPAAVGGGSYPRLADKVKMLRENSRAYHEQQTRGVEEALTKTSPRRTPSPTDEGLLNDPALALGLQYMQSFGSNGSLNSGKGNQPTSHSNGPSPKVSMGIAVGGDGSSSGRSVAGRAKVLNPNAMTHRTRSRSSQLQPSFLPYENESQSSSSERRTPPRLPLPAPPVTETQYFDLSESSSGSTSTSIESDVVLHRMGQQRILVGVNEPFNFQPPLTLSGFTPGQSSRTGIIRAVKAAQLRHQNPESDSSKTSGSDEDNVDCRLWARLEDGGKLPEWLGFDPLEAEFWGVPVPENRGGSLGIKVYFREDQNVMEVGSFIIEVVGR